MAKKEDKGAAVVVTPEEATELRTRIQDRRKMIDESYWELAQDLHMVLNSTCYIEWGFENFASYVTSEVGMKPRSVDYLTGIASWFGKMPKPIQNWVKSLGWSAAKELTGKVTAENWKDIKKDIKGMSVIQINEYFKAQKEAAKMGAELTEEKPKGISFRLFEAQMENVQNALAQAKEMGNTDKSGNALDLICTEFLASHAGETDLNEYLGRIEKTMGIKIVAFDHEGEEVLHGEDMLEEAEGEAAAETSDAVAEPAAEKAEAKPKKAEKKTEPKAKSKGNSKADKKKSGKKAEASVAG